MFRAITAQHTELQWAQIPGPRQDRDALLDAALMADMQQRSTALMDSIDDIRPESKTQQADAARARSPDIDSLRHESIEKRDDAEKRLSTLAKFNKDLMDEIAVLRSKSKTHQEDAEKRIADLTGDIDSLRSESTAKQEHAEKRISDLVKSNQDLTDQMSSLRSKSKTDSIKSVNDAEQRIADLTRDRDKLRTLDRK